MNRLTSLFAGALALLVFTGASVFAQTITVDENGNASGPVSQGVIAIDPTTGQPALCYQLSPTIVGNMGDVLLIEPGQTAPSDLIRFTGNSQMYFYSLQDDNSPPDLADVPALPPPFSSQNITLQEVGPEGNNSAIYQPGAFGIGGDFHFPSLTYTFISDVPEPAAALLLGLGAGSILLKRRQLQAC